MGKLVVDGQLIVKLIKRKSRRSFKRTLIKYLCYLEPDLDWNSFHPMGIKVNFLNINAWFGKQI